MRHDLIISRFKEPDLLSIYQAGYSLPKMIRDALISFAHGQPIKIDLGDTPLTLDDTKKQRARIAVFIPDEDTVTTALLKSIKPRLKSEFLKMVLRNALVSQNIAPFFNDPEQVKRLLSLDGKWIGPVSILRYHRKYKQPLIFAGREEAVNKGKTPLISASLSSEKKDISSDKAATAPPKEILPDKPQPLPKEPEVSPQEALPKEPQALLTESLPKEPVLPKETLPQKPIVEPKENEPADEGVVYLDDDGSISEDDLLDAFDKL